MSSDGSTWDQTSGTVQPAGVDWNQYDEELSGQPSLIFVSQSEETSAVQTEQIISPIEDLIAVSDMNGRAITEADRQMWASEENSVSFPPVTQPVVVAEDEIVATEEEEEDEDDDHHLQENQHQAAANFDDGSFVDEGIAGDDGDDVGQAGESEQTFSLVQIAGKRGYTGCAQFGKTLWRMAQGVNSVAALFCGRHFLVE